MVKVSDYQRAAAARGLSRNPVKSNVAFYVMLVDLEPDIVFLFSC